MHRRQIFRMALAGLTVAAVLLTACGRDSITYVDENRSFSKDSALGLLDGLSAGELAQQPVSASTALRSEALTRLRGAGDDQASAASLITESLPENSGGVPFYVERGSFEGTPAVLVVEARGRQGGVLDGKRLWVLAENGTLLYFGNR